MFCFAFEYNLQYELPPFFCNIAKFAKIGYVLRAISLKVTL